MSFKMVEAVVWELASILFLVANTLNLIGLLRK